MSRTTRRTFQDYRTLPMLPTGQKDRYRAVMPADDVVRT
jgi:hypothetical protein